MVDFKTKLKGFVDPEKVALNEARHKYEQAARAVADFHQANLEVFEEMQSLLDLQVAAETELKELARKPYLGKMGNFIVIDDDSLSVTAATSYGASTYDPRKVIALLGPRANAILTREVDPKKLEKAIAVGTIDEEELKPAIVQGEQKTTKITVRLK